MRALPFLLAGLCFLATPDAAAQVPDEVSLDTHAVEQTLDKAMDESVQLDPHLGPFGACLRQETAEEAKQLYGDRSKQVENPVTECLGAQCIGWPPEPFVSLSNCERVIMETVKDLIDVGAYLQDT